MTNPTTLSTNLTDSVDTFNHWQVQSYTDESRLQNDLKALDGMSPDEAMAYIVTVILNDACNVSGDKIACTSAQLEVQSSIDDYNSTIEGYASEGKDISSEDANYLVQDTYDLYTTLTGGLPPADNPYGNCPSWIDPEDQKALVDNLNAIADSYCNEYNKTSAADDHPVRPAYSYYTPADMMYPFSKDGHTPPSPSEIVINAQTSWAKQVESSSDANGAHIGEQDGYFSKLNHAFQEINSLVNTQNQSLTTQQKTWSDTFNSYQGAWKDMQNYFNSTETNMVNNEAVK